MLVRRGRTSGPHQSTKGPTVRSRITLSVLEDRFLRAGLWFLAATSVVTAIFSVPAAWQTPIILLALILIISLLDPVAEIRTDVRYLRNVYTSAPSRNFNTTREFYDDLGRAVDQAVSTADLTHIRDNPPADFGQEAETYSELIIEWLRRDPSHSARRIISVRSSAMMDYARALQQVQARVPSYRIRVVDWSISAPALNMAIIDGKAVFLALTGETPERTKGFAVEDETTAKYFASYYSVLWGAAVELDEFLARQLSG